MTNEHPPHDGHEPVMLTGDNARNFLQSWFDGEYDNGDGWEQVQSLADKQRNEDRHSQPRIAPPGPPVPWYHQVSSIGWTVLWILLCTIFVLFMYPAPAGPCLRLGWCITLV